MRRDVEHERTTSPGLHLTIFLGTRFSMYFTFNFCAELDKGLQQQHHSAIQRGSSFASGR